MMAAYIDEHESRFKVGPTCRVLSESLDCGFLTPRGYRMFKSRPVSRMRARHEALARDVMDIHAGEFSAVYGYRKVWHELIGKGWDPAEVGRDQVMNIMRGLGIQGVRRGKTPVTAKPAKGTGGRPDLVERRFEAEAPNRLHVADITYVRMANGSFGYTAFAADVFARRIVGWACACLCSISCCGFSHDDFSGLGRACRPRNGLNWMVLVSPPERTGKDYDQHAPSTVYPSFAAERGIRRVDRAENTCQRADGA